MTPRITEDVLRPLSLPERIAALVDAYAPEKGDRQEHFAELVGTNRWTVARWIKGQVPSSTSAGRIAEATGLPVSLFAEASEAAAARRLALALSELVPAAEAVAERLERALGAAGER